MSAIHSDHLYHVLLFFTAFLRWRFSTILPASLPSLPRRTFGEVIANERSLCISQYVARPPTTDIALGCALRWQVEIPFWFTLAKVSCRFLCLAHGIGRMYSSTYRTDWPCGCNSALLTVLLTYLPIYLITYLLIHSMQHSPSWETNSFSASQKIPRILWNPKFHYRTHNSTPPVTIPNQLDPVRVPTSQFLKIHLNIILPSTPGSPQVVSFVQVSPPKTSIRLSSPNTRYMPRPSHATTR
jgi:hypothetical protein